MSVQIIFRENAGINFDYPNWRNLERYLIRFVTANSAEQDGNRAAFALDLFRF